ncbi:unannotated protein [freshwater metagenome]|uniref:Unannotated protein n=1 Tax=freshwater metagenome TaxID=449393 RepID=A0A6J6SGD2_9ZZZZ
MLSNEDIDIASAVEATSFISEDADLGPFLTVPGFDDIRRVERIDANSLDLVIAQHDKSDEAVAGRLREPDVQRIADLRSR